MLRLDKLISDIGLVESRSAAKDALLRRKVVDRRSPEKSLKPSQMVSEEEAPFYILREGESVFVSRAGEKLNSFFEEVPVSMKGARVLDVGASTGGFSEVLLRRGAQYVVGVDVGTHQIHPNVKSNENFLSLENLNAKELSSSEEFLKSVPEGLFDGIVMDVSFISQEKLYNSIFTYLKEGGFYVGLLKPQFEVSKKDLDKKGRPKSRSLIDEVKDRVLHSLEGLQFTQVSVLESKIVGKDGNQEYFVYGKKSV